MTVPKRHHYVPMMLQRSFCMPNGKLWACRVGQGAPFEVSPEKIFLEQHLYREEHHDGSTSVWLEKAFSSFETHCAPLFARMIEAARNRQAYELDDQERANLDAFLYLQIKRVPGIHTNGFMAGEAERTVDRVLEETIAAFPDRLQEIHDLIGANGRERMIKNMKVRAIGGWSEKVLEAMARRGVTIARIGNRERRKFVIGSAPVIRWGKGGLSNPEHQIWMPIASDVAVGLRGPRFRTTLVEGLDLQSVRNLNMSIASQSDMIAGASQELILSLSRPR